MTCLIITGMKSNESVRHVSLESSIRVIELIACDTYYLCILSGSEINVSF